MICPARTARSRTPFEDDTGVHRVQRTYVIAEAGVNHNGSIDLARKMIDVAVSADADAVKFQTFRADRLVTPNAVKADYQTKMTGEAGSQYEMLRKLELDEDSHRMLIAHCVARGIQFLSTPFDETSVDWLTAQFHLPRLKVSSGDLTNGPLLFHIGLTGTPVILSTGISMLGEVEDALAVLAFAYLRAEDGREAAQPSAASFRHAYSSEPGQRLLREKVTLLHCTTEYPSPFEDVHLNAMDTLRRAFGLSVGLSDHTPGIAVPIAAAALGAAVIEKHFTLDRALPGPDHKASLEPQELRAMVESIRQVEQALGRGVKYPASSERKNMSAARKSLVAGKPIRTGESFTNDNLTVKRPGDGMSPMRYWDVLDRTADRDYEVDEQVRT